MIDEKALWEKAAAFHGHTCGGLTIGYKAALYAIQLLDIQFSTDEELVCVTENDACGVDAIQAILGCSVGKGNLLFHITGKQAFSFQCAGRFQIAGMRREIDKTSRHDRKQKGDCGKYDR